MNGLFNLTLGLFLAAAVAAGLALATRRAAPGRVAHLLLIAGVVAQSGYILLRWVEAGRAPFSNMFESLVLFVWAAVAIYLSVRKQLRALALDVALALFAALTLAYASTFGVEIRPLVPALRSNWLTLHVFTCFLGYGAFAVASFVSIGFLLIERLGGVERRAMRDALEEATGSTISFGFLFLTIGIISGAVWANSAWGTYWSWDPKETWSLITWFIYVGFLHCHYMRGWRGVRAAWVSVLGFASVLFTYFGVNFLLAGMHSYA